MDFKKERANLIAQRDNAFAVYHQAIGALTLIDILINEPKDQLTMDEFKDMIGAKSIEVEKVNGGGE